MFLPGNDNESLRSAYSTSNITYIGNYANNKRNGKGKLIFSDQSVYEGNFKDGDFEGEGTFKCRKYIYKGHFSGGKKNGKGYLKDLIKNIEYNGEFKNDLQDGYGIEKYIDGSIYEGYFKKGLKDGNGKMIIKEENNRCYIGEFKEDKLWGKGRYKWNDEKEYFGNWENNEISGFGIFTDGSVKYIGYFEHDQKHGYGANFYSEKSLVLLGKWENDLIEGPAIILPLDNMNVENTSLNNIEKIVIMNKGEKLNIELNKEDFLKIRTSHDYLEELKLYNNIFLPEYKKALNGYELENVNFF